MELSVMFSAVQSVSNKLNIDSISRHNVYSLRVGHDEVTLQGVYSSHIATKIITANFIDLKQLPITAGGFVEFTFVYAEIKFNIVLT